MVAEQDKIVLLQKALNAVCKSIAGYEPFAEANAASVANTAHHGAFVTLFTENALRGCIGYIESTVPLSLLIPEVAAKSATKDFRFAPLQKSDLQHLILEITVLAEMESIASEADIIIGKHGLCITLEEARGILLPQVAEERRWTPRQFLDAVCTKAGLPKDAWTLPGAHLRRFRAEHFSTRELAKTIGGMYG